jgi:hypothetical protein
MTCFVYPSCKQASIRRKHNNRISFAPCALVLYHRAEEFILHFGNLVSVYRHGNKVICLLAVFCRYLMYVLPHVCVMALRLYTRQRIHNCDLPPVKKHHQKENLPEIVIKITQIFVRSLSEYQERT